MSAQRHIRDEALIDHIVELVEAKAAEIEAAEVAETTLHAAE